MSKILFHDEEKPDFPAVSICSLSPFANDTEDVTRSILDNQRYRNQSGPPPIAYLSENLNSRIDSMDNFYVVQSNLSTRPDSFKKLLSFSLEDAVISCRFNQKKCDLSEFVWYYDRLLGNCYRFNTNLGSVKQLKKVDKPGKRNGFQMEMFLGLPFKISPWIYSSGLRIFVHNNSVIPSPDEGIDISAGYETDIKVDRKLINNLPDPYSNCTAFDDRFRTDFYKITVNKTQQTYRQR